MDQRLKQDLKLKRLEENVGKNLLDIGLGNDFLDMTAKARAMRAKINKWDYIKLKSFYTAKETLNKMKRQTIGENIFISYIYKRLISKIYKDLQLISEKTNNLMKSGQRNRHFSKDIQTAKRQLKRCLHH